MLKFRRVILEKGMRICAVLLILFILTQQFSGLVIIQAG